jgi:hypothetical protein
MMTPFRYAAASLTTVTLLAVGCSRSEPAPAPPQPSRPQPSAATGVDAVLQYSNRWIDNPALDLMSSEGTFVRATAESLDRVGYGEGTGLEAIRDGGYPGFARALNNAVDPQVVGGNARKDQAKVGTLYFEVVDFRRDENTFTAGVCTYGSMTDTKVWDGYKSSGRRLPAGSATVMTFGPDPTIPVEAQVAPPSRQRGPARAPSADVFGTWKLTHIEIAAADAQFPQCGNTLAPGTPQDSPDDYYVRPEPPPTLPPSPGWPDAPAQ